MQGMDGGFNAMLQGFGMGQTQARERKLFNEQMAGLERQKATRAKVGEAYAAGNYQDARAQAAMGGDFDLAKEFAGMDETKRAQAKEVAQRASRMAAGIMQMPQEQWAQAIQFSGQQLGMSPEDIQRALSNPQAALTEMASAEADLDKLIAMSAPQIEWQGQQAFAQQTGMGGQAQISQIGRRDPTQEELQAGVPDGMVRAADGSVSWMPGYLEGKKAVAEAGRAQTNINLPDQKGETKFQEARGTDAAARYSAVRQSGSDARSTLATVQIADAILSQIDYTGSGGDQLLQLQKVGQMFGMDLADVTAPKEALKRITTELALAMKKDLPGPMSNADREFLMGIPPNLQSTPRANDTILTIMEMRTEYDIAAAQSLAEANPQSKEEYEAWERAFSASYGPIFSAADRQALLAALRGEGRTVTPQIPEE